ncbi:histamine H2 receptor-like [Glandiceps talaboti]
MEDHVPNTTMGVDPLHFTNNKPPYWNQLSMVVLSVIILIIIIASLIGNGMVILVLTVNKQMRTRTNLFLLNLAIADVGLAGICMPFSLITVIKGKWIFSTELCYFNAFSSALFFIATLHSLMYISVFKYFSILYPLKRIITKRRAIFMIIAIWIAALACAIGPIIGWTRNEYKPAATQCGPAYPETIKQRLHAAFVATTGYVIPLCTMVFCYGRMFWAIHEHSKRLQKNTIHLPAAISKTQQKATMTMFIVMSVFMLCWTPYFVYAVWAIMKKSRSIPLWYNSFAYWFGYANSAMSPIIYAWRYVTYREAFKRLCHCQRAPLYLSYSTPIYGSPATPRKLGNVTTPQMGVQYSKIHQPNSLEITPTGSPLVKIHVLNTPGLPDLQALYKGAGNSGENGHCDNVEALGGNDDHIDVFINPDDGLKPIKRSKTGSIAKFLRTRFKSAPVGHDSQEESDDENTMLQLTSLPTSMEFVSQHRQ